MNKYQLSVIIVFLVKFLLINSVWAYEAGTCVGVNEISLTNKPVWAGRAFDLIYDANWVVIKGSFAKLNRNDELFISTKGDYQGNKMQGLRFTTGSDWEKFASGKVVKVTIEAKSSTQSNILFKVAYVTNEVGFSGWREAVAGKHFSRFSFDYKVSKMIKGKDDFVIVFPNSSSNNDGILIRKATLEVYH